MGYRQLQQERVQLLIGQSTLQIQEQSTLGTMQQSSLQHYSVLGRILVDCTEKCIQDYGAAWLEQYGVTAGLSTASCRLLGSHTRRLHQAYIGLYTVVGRKSLTL